jgi:hypothetical protein
VPYFPVKSLYNSNATPGVASISTSSPSTIIAFPAEKYGSVRVHFYGNLLD